MRRQADGRNGDRRSAVRDGWGIAGGMLVLVVAICVILLVMGLWRRFARETVATLMDLPGGSWGLGSVLGLITALGVFVGLRRVGTGGGSRSARALRAAVATASGVAAFGPFFYLLSGLRGRNCRSESCAYIPGSGSALLAYAISAGMVGWLLWRWNRARNEETAARERERVRRLRKKGKGKSRTVQGR